MAQNYELEKELYDYCVLYASRSQFPLEFEKIRAHFYSQPIFDLQNALWQLHDDGLLVVEEYEIKEERNFAGALTSLRILAILSLSPQSRKVGFAV